MFWPADPEFTLAEGAARVAAGIPLSACAGVAVSAAVGLARVFGAANAWIDFVHVRQDWNRWRTGLPVFGWATYLRSSYATVDAPGVVDGTWLVERNPALRDEIG